MWSARAIDVPSAPVAALLSFGALAVFLELAGVSLSGGAVGSVTFIVQIAAGLLFGPFAAGLMVAGSMSVSELLSRKSLLKGLFNVAQRTLATVAATSVYVVLGGGLPFHSIETDGLAFVALATLYFGVNSATVATVIALDSGKSFNEVWNRLSRGSLAYDIAASSVALLVVWAYGQFRLLGLALVVSPIIVVRSVYLMYHRLQAQSREMLELMVKAIEARDPYTSGHSVRVSAMSRAIAAELKLPYEKVEQIATAALLHDVGKIHEKFAPVLRKEARLTPEEQALLQEHPVKSAELVGVISGFKGTVLDSVRGHHERWDGNGYPDRLAGDAIPLGARIIAIADTVDAMRTDRPYRRAATYEETVRELERCRGSQFDPAIIDVALGSMLVRSMFAAPQDVRGLSDSAAPEVVREPRRVSGWMRVLR
jgi:putative nucleotidyltransferase with HDIG domain